MNKPRDELHQYPGDFISSMESSFPSLMDGYDLELPYKRQHDLEASLAISDRGSNSPSQLGKFDRRDSSL